MVTWSQCTGQGSNGHDREKKNGVYFVFYWSWIDTKWWTLGRPGRRSPMKDLAWATVVQIITEPACFVVCFVFLLFEMTLVTSRADTRKGIRPWTSSAAEAFIPREPLSCKEYSHERRQVPLWSTRGQRWERIPWWPVVLVRVRKITSFISRATIAPTR